ncbi:MAG: alpha/beta hydrolase [Planctomycetota bacterium]
MLLPLLLSAVAPQEGQLALTPDPDGPRGALRGSYEVYEDRERRDGRRLHLDVVVYRATGEEPAPEPIFWIAGGPGQRATAVAPQWSQSRLRDRYDLVFVDQRGTGGDHELACELGGGSDLQAYLDAMFDPDFYAGCRDELEERFDLRLYSTPIAMDDLDEVRAALGYERIHLMGGSYGTRAALVYLRRHPATVRAAVLNGVAPLAFTNPLYHAAEAQASLARTFADCAADPACSAAFPELEQAFLAVLERLEAKPARVKLADARSGREHEVRIDRDAFAEAVRVMLYSVPSARRLPLLIQRAYEGEYAPFAAAAVQVGRALRDQLALGMLLSVTCAEDVARIDPADIEPATAGTFLGDARVRAQSAVCGGWPRAELPEGFAEPVRSTVPVLLLSGSHDPVTGPRWGSEAARHLDNALHLVVPGAHGVGGPCVSSIVDAFLERGTVEGLDTSCVVAMTLPPFALPD